jgi:outer membrane receptor protein involved in Fe transport
VTKPLFIPRKARLLTGAASTALLLSFSAVPAFAQVQPSAGDSAAPAVPATATGETEATSDIVVTGSRISRPDLLASSPVATISAETLRATNTVTVESYLTESPQFVAGTTATTNNGADGTATVDLRGLGSNRTLVLIDGKRMVPSSIGGSVDINAIPSILIKRIDVLTGGASSVYGADAIAGVVNFVLDDKFEGFKVDASSQITSRGDAPQYNATAALGIKLGDRGHLVIGGDYTKRAGIYQDARAYSAQATDSSVRGTGPGGLGLTGSSNTTPTQIDLTRGSFQLNNGSQPGAVNDFVTPYQLYNFNPANYLQTPLERYNATALLSYQLTDGIELFARGSYTHSAVTAILAPTATAGFNFIISPNNPFLTAQQRSVIFADPADLNPDGTANVAIRRRITETGGRIENFENSSYFGMGGLRGAIAGKYHWEVSAQYGETDQTQNLLNDLSYTALSQAVNAVPGAGGVGAACADPSNGCVPIDLFSTTPIPANQLAYVLRNGHQSNKYTQFDVNGSIGGNLDFVQSPFASGPAAISIGVEYRKETGNQLVDANYGSGDLIYYGQGTAVPNASFNTKEVFGELKVPLASDKPFLEQLNIEGGIRYSHYTNNTTAGSSSYDATTYKFGGDWTPVRGFRLRALFNRAIRDPTIAELNSPVVSGTDNLAVDPCTGAAGTGAISAATQAICIAQGAPAASFVNGVSTVKPPIAGQVNALIGGNTSLKPEKANTLTIGAVISPPQLRNFNMTVDYYTIKIEGYIATNGGSIDNLADQCFNHGNSAYCAAFIRNPFNGQLSGGTAYGVLEGLANASTLKSRGIDVTATYRVPLGSAGRIDLDFAGTYTLQYDLTPAAGLAPIQCAGKFGFACNLNPIPNWKHNLNVTYGLGSVSLLGRWRMIGAVSEDVGTDIIKSRIGAQSYFDSTLMFDVNKQFGLRIGIENMFDKDPPNVGGTAGGTAYNSANTFPGVYDSLGRTFFAGASVKF